MLRTARRRFNTLPSQRVGRCYPEGCRGGAASAFIESSLPWSLRLGGADETARFRREHRRCCGLAARDAGGSASRSGVREPRRAHAAARPRDHVQVSCGRGAGAGRTGFKYVGEWRSDSGAVLEFENEIEGIRINGVDIITFTADGTQIAHFKGMIRPLKAIDLVHRLMGKELARG